MLSLFRFFLVISLAVRFSQVFPLIFIRLLYYFHELSFHVLSLFSVVILVVLIYRSSQCIVGLLLFFHALLLEK